MAFDMIAHAELPPDERKGARAAFMGPCLRFLEGIGMRVARTMTDSEPSYRNGGFSKPPEPEGALHTYTRPFSPWQSSRVERVNRTLAQE